MAVQPTGTHKEQKAQDSRPEDEQKRREMGGEAPKEVGENEAANEPEEGEDEAGEDEPGEDEGME